jgi:hypothetical protein
MTCLTILFLHAGKKHELSKHILHKIKYEKKITKIHISNYTVIDQLKHNESGLTVNYLPCFIVKRDDDVHMYSPYDLKYILEICNSFDIKF